MPLQYTVLIWFKSTITFLHFGKKKNQKLTASILNNFHIQRQNYSSWCQNRKIEKKLMLTYPCTSCMFCLFIKFISEKCYDITSSSDFLGLYINSVTKTWKDASRSCSLVGSDRPPSYDVIAQEIPVLGSRYQGGRPQAGTFYWIGATATFTPWFELLGRELF